MEVVPSGHGCPQGAPHHISVVILNRRAQIARTSPKSLLDDTQIADLNCTICDSNLCSDCHSNHNAHFLHNKSEHSAFLRWFTLSQIATDLEFAIRITNCNRNQIVQFGDRERERERIACTFPWQFLFLKLRLWAQFSFLSLRTSQKLPASSLNFSAVPLQSYSLKS